jgi:hypothetical protein
LTYLKNYLSDLIQVPLFDAENENAWPFDTLKLHFISFKKVISYDVQKADYEFPGPFTYLKYHLNAFIQDASFVIHVAVNEFVWLSTQ